MRTAPNIENSFIWKEFSIFGAGKKSINLIAVIIKLAIYVGQSQYLRPIPVLKFMVAVSRIMITVSTFTKLVIVTNYWQKLNSVERRFAFIVADFWQLFSHIFGETSLIVTNIWRNHTCRIKICILYTARPE